MTADTPASRLKKIGVPPLHIGDTEGFKQEKDPFGYHELGQHLTNLVDASEGPLVLLFDGSWGTGKTTFAKQWAGNLRNADHPVIYFDAFEYDGEQDAFFALAGEVLRRADPADPASEIADFIETAVFLAETLLGTSFLALTGAPLPVPRHRPSRRARTLLRRRIEAVRDQQKSTERFRKALGQLCDTPSQKRLVFIVDELDRCRPSFALNLLERIKHFFDVDQICFALVTDAKALGQMITKSYGIDDPHSYLRKFFHLRIDLTAAASQPLSSQRRHYLDEMCRSRRVALRKEGEPAHKLEFEVLAALADRHELSLRDLEEITLCVHFADLSMTRSWSDGALTAGLAFMKTLSPNLFKNARRGTLATSDAADFLGLAEWQAPANAVLERAARVWTWVLGTDAADAEDRKLRSRLEDDLRTYNLEGPAAALSHVCRHVDALVS